MDDLRWDHSVAAMMLILELFDSSAGAPKHQLASTIQFIVLECLKRYEAETRPAVTHSVN